VLKRVVLALALVELVSFGLVTLSNAIIYGSPREGSRVVYDPYALSLGSAGPRRTTGGRAAQSAERRRRIWMFGGSTARCDHSLDDQTIASHLARTLNQRRADLDVEVRNFGENSFNSLLEVKYLQRLLIEEGAQPDLIVFYDGFNDASYLLQYGTPHGHRRLNGLIGSYHRSPVGLLKPVMAAAYASFTHELIEKLGVAFRPVAAEDPLLEEFATCLERRYDFVAEAARSARFVLVWQPFAWVEATPVDPEVAQAERATLLPARRLGAFVANLVCANGVAAARLAARPYFVDARNALCARRSPVYRSDGVHLTDGGNRFAAQAIGQALLERHPLDRPAPHESGSGWLPLGDSRH
jgi:lysophospholipase L1-like esterase